MFYIPLLILACSRFPVEAIPDNSDVNLCSDLFICWEFLSNDLSPIQKVNLLANEHKLDNFAMDFSKEGRSYIIESPNSSAILNFSGNSNVLMRRGVRAEFFNIDFYISINFAENFIRLEENSSLALKHCSFLKVAEMGVLVKIHEGSKLSAFNISFRDTELYTRVLFNLLDHSEISISHLLFFKANLASNLRIIEGKDLMNIMISNLSFEFSINLKALLCIINFSGYISLDSVRISNSIFFMGVKFIEIISSDPSPDKFHRLNITELVIDNSTDISTILYLNSQNVTWEPNLNDWRIRYSNFIGDDSIILFISSNFSNVSLTNMLLVGNIFYNTFLTSSKCQKIFISNLFIMKNKLINNTQLFSLEIGRAYHIIKCYVYGNLILEKSTIFNFIKKKEKNAVSIIFFVISQFWLNEGLSETSYKELSMLVTIQADSDYYFQNANFIYNRMKRGNPCAVLFNNDANLTFNGVLLIGNMGLEFSNTISFYGKMIIFKKLIFLENTALYEIGKIPSSGIIFEGDFAVFENCKVFNNTSNFGNFLQVVLSYRTSSTYLTILNSEFENNTGSRPSILIFELNNLNFFVNNCTVKYGFCSVSGTFLGVSSFGRNIYYLTWKNSFFFNNTALFYGGVIKMIYNNIQYFFLINCTFYKNTANRQGGAILFGTLKYTFLITISCLFKMNTAFEGGAIEDWIGNVEDYGSVFEENVADHAATYFVSSYSQINLTNTQIKGAKSHTSYNIMIAGMARLIALNITIEGCAAGIYNSAIAAYKQAEVLVENSIFIGNSARFGTLIRSTYLNKNIVLINCDFINNYAVDSLFFFNSATIFIERSTIIGNKGRNFILINTVCLFNQLVIKNHICKDLFSGCLIKSKQNTRAVIKGIEVTNTSIISASLLEFENSYIAIKSGNIRESQKIPFGTFFIKIFNSDASFVQLTVWTSSSVFLYAFESSLLLNESIILMDPNVPPDQKILACSFIDTYFNISNVSFSKFTNGAVRVVRTVTSNLKIENDLLFGCIFEGNRAEEGGALIVYDSNITIAHCEFIKNLADKNGGAINIKCKDFSCFTNADNSKFQENGALSGGGGSFFWNNIPVNTSNCLFKNNFAKYGNDLASPAIFLIQEALDKDQNLTRYLSGSSISYLNFTFRDYYNQTVTTLNDKVASLYLKNLIEDGFANMRGFPLASSENGIIRFENIILISPPGSTCYVIIETDAINYLESSFLLNMFKKTEPNKNLTNKDNNNQQKYRLKLQTLFVPCIIGQVYDPIQKVCITCPMDYFSLVLSENICRPCPEHAECAGGDRIILKPGFWRLNKGTSKIYKCKIFYSCLGGDGNSSVCFEGFAGRLCDRCEDNGDKV